MKFKHYRDYIFKVKKCNFKCAVTRRKCGEFPLLMKTLDLICSVYVNEEFDLIL